MGSRLAPRNRYGTPRATYRLQLHAGFDLDAAAATVPYLAALGISHLYLSPITTALPGSLHGYDVTDHNEVNPELGGLPALQRLHAALCQHDMGLIVDIVPNHVGIGSNNPWWADVLRYGRESAYAGYFDIDWDAQPHLARGVLVVPELARPFGETLESGELRLQLAEGLPRVRYGDRHWPLSPASIAAICLDAFSFIAPEGLLDPAAPAAALATIDGLRRSRPADAASLLRELGARVASEPALQAALERKLATLNGKPGDSQSFDALEAILLDQHYRLADWRVAAEDLNYRRFFDVNGLAAIRVERQDVFDATHGMLFDLARDGVVTGVRVDHIDGLYEPAAYLARLRAGLDAACGVAGAIPIYVEKILAADELLPSQWQTEGTTGYEFAARADGLFVDPEAEAAMTSLYQAFTGSRASFGQVNGESRTLEARLAFAGEINVLALQLHRIAQRDRIHRDHTLSALRGAIRAMLVAFPVYRTYVPDEEHGARIRAATGVALRDPDLVSPRALLFLQEVLLLGGERTDASYQVRMHFRRRFEQISGPIMAKGIEDTAFYRYNRLLALNEVGATPERFGTSVGEAHRWLAERAERATRAMLAGTTHDTKRSEDVRARIAVLTDIPGAWARQVRAWSRLNERHRVPLGGGAFAPDGNLEYYLYQTLVGTAVPGEVDEAYRQRIRDHIRKAAREAKTQTSWTAPDPAFEHGCMTFIDAILADRGRRPFVRRLEGFVRSISPAGAVNALSATLLRALAPGFPDFYQGTEATLLAMADPDNRRPVDFERRRCLLAMQTASAPDVLDSDEARTWLTSRLLRLRAEHRELFEGGGYGPVETPGTSRAFAFARTFGGRSIVALVPRLMSRSVDATGHIPADAWGDAAIVLPREGRWCEVLSGRQLVGKTLPLRDVLALLPFGVLVSENV